MEAAILDGAHQIALPALVSTLSICIVFVPMFLLAGIAKFLFIPLAEAVVFAMLASYLLSRTLVPTLAKYLAAQAPGAWRGSAQTALSFFARLQTSAFERHFERLASLTTCCWRRALQQRAALRRPFSWGRWSATALLAFPFGVPCRDWARTSFPRVDAGQIKLHLRARTGTRIEETAALCDAVEATIREVIPATRSREHRRQYRSALQRHQSGLQHVGTRGPGGRRHLRQSRRTDHTPSVQYVRALRTKLAASLPVDGVCVSARGHVSQITEFRPALARIDVQIVGDRRRGQPRYARSLLQKLRGVPGAVDLHVQQDVRLPAVQRRCRPHQGTASSA